jgi:hypothetical protein
VTVCRSSLVLCLSLSLPTISAYSGHKFPESPFMEHQAERAVLCLLRTAMTATLYVRSSCNTQFCDADDNCCRNTLSSNTPVILAVGNLHFHR